MNLIIAGFHSDLNMRIIDRIFHEFQITLCHLFYYEKKPNIPPNIDVYYHQVEDVRNFGNYHVNEASLLPLDNEILEQLEHNEINFLEIMERINRIDEYRDSYYSRKNQYLKHLKYWNHVFNTQAINLVILDCIPHVNFAYIIYSLAKLKQIPIIILFQVSSDITMFIDEIEEPSLKLKQTYQELLHEYHEKKIEDIELTGPYLDFYQKQTQTDQPRYFYMKRIYNRPSVLARLKSFFWILFHTQLRYYPKKFGGLLQERLLFRYYEKLTINPDLSQKYIYFGLHFQPELTSSPLGGHFADQLLIVYLLSYFSPDDVVIYVKEHPNQRLLGRTRQFYKELVKIPKVVLISRSFSSFELIQSAKAVVTITGTSGLEAIFREKPVLLFGKIFYQYIQGIYQINSFKDCQHAMHEIFDLHQIPRLKEVKIYMKALELSSFKGYIDKDYEIESNLSQDENFSQIHEILALKIKEIIQTYGLK